MNEFRVGSMCVGVCVGLLYTPSGGLRPHPRNSGAAPRNSQFFPDTFPFRCPSLPLTRPDRLEYNL